MLRLQTIAERISRVGAIVGGALLLIASIAICIDITLRYTLSWTVGGADELSGYALAIASAWGLSAAVLTRSHGAVVVGVEPAPPGWRTVSWNVHAIGQAVALVCATGADARSGVRAILP